MTKTQVSTQDLIKEFTKATFNGDLQAIEDLLDEELEVIETDKYEFLNWYNKILVDVKIKKSTYDQCVGCRFGNHVVLFNDGYFPRIQKDSSDREKTAIMIDSKDGKINNITFCFVFLQTENRYIFDCVGKIIVDDMKKGTTMGQAIKNYDTSKDYDHYKFPEDSIDEDVYDYDERLDCFKDEDEEGLPF